MEASAISHPHDEAAGVEASAIESKALHWTRKLDRSVQTSEQVKDAHQPRRVQRTERIGSNASFARSDT